MHGNANNLYSAYKPMNFNRKLTRTKIGTTNNNIQNPTITKPPIPPATKADPLSAERQYLPSERKSSTLPFFVRVASFVIIDRPPFKKLTVLTCKIKHQGLYSTIYISYCYCIILYILCQAKNTALQLCFLEKINVSL
jgi:hypothetical protein